jgi:hypothetical protein
MQDQLHGTPRELVVSYRKLRRAVGTVGLLLPLVLGPGGWLLGIEIQDTMSSYYHTPLRDVLVGALFSLGMLLYCYRGYDRLESWTANAAAALAMCLALFPLDEGTDPLLPRSPSGVNHTLSGGAFFVVLAIYSLHHFPRTGGDRLDRQRRLIYLTTGITLLVSTAAMGTLILLGRGQLGETIRAYNLLFWLEWIAVWAFAAAWLTKGRMIVTEIAAELLAWPMDVLERLRDGRRG